MTMKVRSLALFLAIVMVVGSAAVAFANTNPFSDVPADHWAYDAVTELAAVGLVEGYPDGTYGGTRMMTRYEAALVFARLLARLEAMVEDEVYATNAGLREQVVAEVLADIEAAKAELAALIKEELANIEVPVVEHTVERVVVEQPIEKIVEVQPVERPFQLTPEAENIITKLVADLFKKELEAAELGAKDVVVETKIIERIVEAEDAVTEEDVNRIAEALLAAELEKVYASQDAAIADVEAWIGNVVKRVHENTASIAALSDENARLAGLIEGLQGDVAALESALVGEVDRLTNMILNIRDEFQTELALLGVRVDTLEKLFISLEERISGVEGRVALVEQEQAALRKDLERVQLGGELKFTASSSDTSSGGSVYDWFTNEYKAETLGLTQSGKLTLNVKASDSTTVKAYAAYDIDIFDNASNADPEYAKFKDYRVEVTSSTPITSFVAGNKIDKFMSELINSYVLSPTLGQGASAEFKFFDGFTGAAVVGGTKENMMGAAALSYQFIPELGLKAAVSGSYVDEYTVNAASAGVFGELFGIEYEGDFAIDLTVEDPENNMFFGGKLTYTYDPITIWGEYVWAGDDFGTSDDSLSGRPFLFEYDDPEAPYGKSMLGLGASAKFLGIDLNGRYYREMDADNEALVDAYDFGASYGFTLYVPVTLSGKYASNRTSPATSADTAAEVKVKIGDINVGDTGLSFNTSVGFIKGLLVDNPDIDDEYKYAKYFEDKDALVADANLKYKTTFGGAGLDLGYGIQFVMPMVAEGEPEEASELTHKLTADYAFTDALKLNLKATLFHTLDEEPETAQKYSAGLTFAF